MAMPSEVTELRNLLLSRGVACEPTVASVVLEARKYIDRATEKAVTQSAILKPIVTAAVKDVSSRGRKPKTQE